METEEYKDIELILDSHRGIYIPRDFAESVDRKYIKDADKFAKDLDICLNPNHEWYWESWNNILDNMQIDLMGNGTYYHLMQDGDLFAVIYKDEE